MPVKTGNCQIKSELVHIVSAYVVAKSSKTYILENGFTFTLIALTVQSIVLLVSNPDYFVKYPELDFLDLFVPIFACSIILFLFKKRAT